MRITTKMSLDKLMFCQYKRVGMPSGWFDFFQPMVALKLCSKEAGHAAYEIWLRAMIKANDRLTAEDIL